MYHYERAGTLPTSHTFSILQSFLLYDKEGLSFSNGKNLDRYVPHHSQNPSRLLLTLPTLLPPSLPSSLPSSLPPQSTCAGTRCRACWAWPGPSVAIATRRRPCCPSCSRGPWWPCRRRPTTGTPPAAAPSATSAPSCPAPSSPCARKTRPSARARPSPGRPSRWASAGGGLGRGFR